METESLKKKILETEPREASELKAFLLEIADKLNQEATLQTSYVSRALTTLIKRVKGVATYYVLPCVKCGNLFIPLRELSARNRLCSKRCEKLRYLETPVSQKFKENSLRHSIERKEKIIRRLARENVLKSVVEARDRERKLLSEREALTKRLAEINAVIPTPKKLRRRPGEGCIYKIKNSNNWYIKYRRSGMNIVESSRTSEYIAAEKLLAQRLNKGNRR